MLIEFHNLVTMLVLNKPESGISILSGIMVVCITSGKWLEIPHYIARRGLYIYTLEMPHPIFDELHTILFTIRILLFHIGLKKNNQTISSLPYRFQT